MEVMTLNPSELSLCNCMHSILGGMTSYLCSFFAEMQSNGIPSVIEDIHNFSCFFFSILPTSPLEAHVAYVLLAEAECCWLLGLIKRNWGLEESNMKSLGRFPRLKS